MCARRISTQKKKKILEEQVRNNQVDKIRLWFQPGNKALQGWNMARIGQMIWIKDQYYSLITSLFDSGNQVTEVRVMLLNNQMTNL